MGDRIFPENFWDEEGLKKKKRIKILITMDPDKGGWEELKRMKKEERVRIHLKKHLDKSGHQEGLKGKERTMIQLKKHLGEAGQLKYLEALPYYLQ